MAIKYTNQVISGPNLIYVVRHGQSIGNARGLKDKSLKDIPNHRFTLTDKGHKEMTLTGKFIYDNKIIKPITGLYVSNFLRSPLSIEDILKIHLGDHKVKIDSRLDEWWKGIFYTLTQKQIRRQHPLEQKVLNREGWHHYRPPQGQSGKDVESNLISFLSDVPEEEILAVGHARSFAFLRRLLTNQPVHLNCRYPLPRNGEIWKFMRNGDFYDFESLYTPEVK